MRDDGRNLVCRDWMGIDFVTGSRQVFEWRGEVRLFEISGFLGICVYENVIVHLKIGL